MGNLNRTGYSTSTAEHIYLPHKINYVETRLFD